jgi:ATP-dependent DNA helicase RecG
MTPERLRELIGGGETIAVEFKGEAGHALSDQDLVEAIICLANRSGGEPGWLLIGVEDDGRITGARTRHAGRTDPVRLQALISGRTRPSLTPAIEVVTLDGHEIVVVEVPPVRTQVGTTDGKYLRRGLGGDGRPACLPLHFHEMQALQADRGLLDYSALPVPGAGWDDLDPLEFERFRRFIRESRGQGDASLVDLPDLELAKALGAVEANHDVSAVRVLGLLLFGREEALRRLLPSHEVAFQALSGQQVEVNDFFRWPLLRVIDEILARFRARNREEELIVGLLRIGVPDYPERAFREAVANALIHRDYTRLGAVHIQWHDDRVEISNPGGFPEGVRLDNLLVTPPRPRNPLLADAFKRAGLVEARGERKGRTWHLSAATYRRLGERAAYVRQRGFEPLQQEQMILQYVDAHGTISRAEVAELCRLSPPQAYRLLRRLVRVGTLKPEGARGRGVRYAQNER